MDNRNLEKAMDIYAKLIMGESVKKGSANENLYEEYYQNADVYEFVDIILKKLNLSIYEYNESLFLTAGEGNRIFGYTNEELRRALGLRYNKELYLIYFIMYHILTCFYTDTASYQFKEYVKIENVMDEITKTLTGITKTLFELTEEEMKEESFKMIAHLWDELPAAVSDDSEGIRASKSSRAGFVKLTFNFMMGEELFIEVEERYHPTDRFKALAENYFEEYRGRLYEILKDAEADKEREKYNA